LSEKLTKFSGLSVVISSRRCSAIGSTQVSICDLRCVGLKPSVGSSDTDMSLAVVHLGVDTSFTTGGKRGCSRSLHSRTYAQHCSICGAKDSCWTTLAFIKGLPMTFS
jgi:hypothetical protein